MATVVKPPQSWNRAETDTRVRHPLHRLRSYIRAYVTIEGVSVFFLYLVVWFWVGLLLDFGVFKLFAYDWVREMPRLIGGDSFEILRVGMLVILLGGLLALVTTKVLLRLLREFRDGALALVLERRYPRQLGDRLITAVEMADPRQAAVYGHSQPLVDQTIREAADRVDTVPVSGVFNWGRLYRYGAVLAGLTLGTYLLIGVAYCLIAQEGPGKFFYRSRDVAAIWAERNLLLQNSLWPRSAYLEVIRFKGSKKDPNEMRIGDNAPTAEIWVRASRWVIADQTAPDGWRPLRWRDLPDILGYTPDVKELPVEWDGWAVDIDDLDEHIPSYLIPEDWRGKTTRYVREDLKYPGGKSPKLLAMLSGLPLQGQGLNLANVGLAAAAFRENDLLTRAEGKKKSRTPAWPAGVRQTVEQLEKYEAMQDSLFRWQEWTVDRIALQLEQKVEAMNALRAALARTGASTVGLTAGPRGANPLAAAAGLIAGKGAWERHAQAALEFAHEKEYQKIQKVFDDLEAVVEAGDVERTVRKLDLPEEVLIYSYGETTKNKKTFARRSENKYQVVIDRLPESVKFYVQGEDFYTPEKKITLVPRPRVDKMFADREEPAYIYYRMQGPAGELGPQLVLKGKKQLFRDQSVYVSDVVSRIEVPVGSNITLTAESSDLLKDQVRIEPARTPAGTSTVVSGKDPLTGIRPKFVKELGAENRKKFWVRFDNVTRKIDFNFKFTNEDNVDGERHVIIEPTPDKHPDVTVNIIENVFRKKRNSDAYLITPRARVPFKGVVTDDRGLNDVRWVYQVKEARVEATRGKIYTALTALQGTPVSEVQAVMGPAYLSWLLGRMARVDAGTGKTADVAQYRQGTKLLEDQIRAALTQGVTLNGDALLAKYALEVKERKDNEVDPATLRRALAKEPPKFTLLKTFTLKTDEDAFSFKEHMPWLVTPSKEVFQTHYLVELWVTATDNNVESQDPQTRKYRPVVSESKQRFTFEVVSENDLLAEIFREEEDLREDLEKLFKKLNDAKTKFDTQVLPGVEGQELPGRDRALKGTRANEVKKVINMVGKDIGGVHSAFSRILLELEANDVQKSSISRVKEKICEPLEQMMDKTKGDFKLAEDAVEKLQLILEKDQKGDQQQRTVASRDARDKIDQLISRLSAVLEAMQKIIGKDELLRDLIEQEQKQRRQFAELKAHRDYLIQLITGEAAVEEPEKKP
jgi:hypothetical protein